MRPFDTETVALAVAVGVRPAISGNLIDPWTHRGSDAWCFRDSFSPSRDVCCAHWEKVPAKPAPTGCFDDEILTDEYCCSDISASEHEIDGDMPDLYRKVWTRRPVPILLTPTVQGGQRADGIQEPLVSWKDPEQQLLRNLDRLFEQRNDFCKTRWLGMQVLQTPTELVRLMNLVYRVRPTSIVETGTYRGGLTWFLAHALDVAGVTHGKVFTIDQFPLNESLRSESLCPVCSNCKYPRSSSVWHRRVVEFVGRADQKSDSALRELVQAVKGHQDRFQPHVARSIVVLDAAHDAYTVSQEFLLLEHLVSIDGYAVFQDTQLDRMYASPGPRAAAMLALLQSNMGYVWDRSDEAEVHAILVHHMFLKRFFTHRAFTEVTSLSLASGEVPTDLKGLSSQTVMDAQAWIWKRRGECDHGC